MYVNPIAAGVVATVMFELFAIVIYAVVKQGKGRK